MYNTTSIIINIFVLIFAFTGFLTSIGILFLIFHYRHRSPINTSTLLICNTYISVIFTSALLIDMYARYLYGDLNDNISFDDLWCYLRVYFLYVGFCLIYHSFLLQAVFRLFRVVFYRHKRLQTRRFMFGLVLIQWLVDFLSMLPLLLLHYFYYLPEYYCCEILLSNNQGMLSIGVIGYTFPLNAMALIYYYIVYYMKKTKSQSILQNRYQANQRDLVVVRRILILIGMLFSFGVPTSVIWFGYIFTGYVNPIGYRLGWSLFTFSLSVLPIMLVFLTPQLRELLILTFRRNRRILPTVIN